MCYQTQKYFNTRKSKATVVLFRLFMYSSIFSLIMVFLPSAHYGNFLWDISINIFLEISHLEISDYSKYYLGTLKRNSQMKNTLFWWNKERPSNECYGKQPVTRVLLLQQPCSDHGWLCRWVWDFWDHCRPWFPF